MARYELLEKTLEQYNQEPINHSPATGVTVRLYKDTLQLIYDVHQTLINETGEEVCMGCGLHFVYPCPTIQALEKGLSRGQLRVL